MKVAYRLFVNLKKYSPDKSGRGGLELSPNARVRDLIRALGIPDETRRVVLVNGRLVGEDRELAAGDEVVMFPPVEGG